MAGPAEDQDEFEAYRAQRRGSGQSAATDEVDEFKAYQQTKRGKGGKRAKVPVLDALNTSAQSGARFGLADEAQGVKTRFNMVSPVGPLGVFSDVGAGIAGLFMEAGAEKKGQALPENYMLGRDLSRNALATAREDRPVTSFVGEVAGSAVYPGGALRMGAPILGQTAKLGAIGAAQGAAYGYASADGNTEDRQQGAQLGAAFGGVAGGALPSAAAAALPVVRGARTTAANLADRVVELFGGTGTAGDAVARQVAEAAVRRSMERSGMTPERIAEALDRFADKPAVLAEVIGQDAINTLSSLTRRAGSTPQAAQDIIAERMGGFAGRAADDLRQTTGLTDAQIRGEFGPELAARREVAAPVYGQLFEEQGNVASERLAALSGTNTLGPLIRRSQAAAQDLAVTQRRDPASVTPLEVLDLAKRELDDEIATAQRNQQNSELFRLQSLQTALLDELDTLTGGQYAAAREVGGEAPRLQQARLQGEQAMRPSVTRATVNEQVNALNPQDRPAFASGTASRIDEDIAGGRLAPQRFRLPANQEKVQAAFGQEAGGEFVRRMTAEAELRDLASRWGPRQGSITGTVLESGPSEALDDGIRFATAMARGDRIGLVNQAVSWMRRRGYNQQQIDAMGELLLSNPQEGLQRLGIQLPRLPGGGAAAAGAAAGGAAPPQVPPPTPNTPAPTNALSGLRSNEAGPIRAGGFAGFHGTQRKFDKFDLSQSEDELGIHFGTKSQAEARNRTTGFDKAPNRVIEAEIADGNYLELPDLNMWRPQAVRQALAEKGIELPETVQTNAQIREYLASQGFDGIRYANRAEGAGESVIVFDPNRAAIVGETSSPMSFQSATPRNGLSGLRTDLGAGIGGAAFTSAMPMDADATLEDRLARAGTGFLLGYGASKGGRVGARMLGRNALAGETASAGMGAPKTAQQAARFETPGSPEYEAAKAKGLDMSTPARKARAQEMGFNTDKVYYHGTTADFDQFSRVMSAKSSPRDGMLGIHLGTSRQANDATSLVPLKKKKSAGREFPPDAQILPVYVSAKNPIRLEDQGGWSPANLAMQLAKRGIIVKPYGSANGAYHMQDVRDAIKEAGFDSIVYKNTYEGVGEDSLIVLDERNIRSVNAAFDPDKAASPILTAGIGGGGRGPRKPKPDSPEAIAAEVRKLATKKPAEPTRLERMVEEGKDASVPPINTMLPETDAAAAKAERMLERGMTPMEVYDQTDVVFIPYNGANVPIVSKKMGPEEVIRAFYSALSLSPQQRPDWVTDVLQKAPQKKGLMLMVKNRITQPIGNPDANALAPQPLPPERFPAGAVALGTAAGIATGVPAGALAGYAMTRDQQRPRNALSGQ